MTTDVHVAGTTCTDHSLLGTLNRDDGKNVKFYFVWVAIMRELRPPAIVHENVVGFGFSGLEADLGDLYVICPSRFCASDFGFPIRRSRQMCVLVLRDWVVAGLRAAGHSNKCSDSSLRRLVDLEATLRSCCVRTPTLQWRHFLVATDADQEEERVRNAARPSVVARMQLIDAGETHTRRAPPAKPCRCSPTMRLAAVLLRCYRPSVDDWRSCVPCRTAAHVHGV